MLIRIQLDGHPDISGFLSTQLFRIYTNFYPDISGFFGPFFNGYCHYIKHNKLYSRQFFDHPDISGFFPVQIRMAIRWIENHLYVEGPVQSGYIRMVIQTFFTVQLLIKSVFLAANFFFWLLCRRKKPINSTTTSSKVFIKTGHI